MLNEDMENKEPRDPRAWYVIHTYSGYENKVKANLENKVKSQNLENEIFNVVVPVEDETEIKNGKKDTKKRKIFPGYVLVDMIVDNYSWYVVRNTEGVTGFVGTNPNQRPRPISNDEVRNILQRSGDIKGEKTVRVTQAYNIGDQVKINEGPFASFSGAVEEIYPDKSKMRVMVQIFGRATPVEVDITQVEKLVQ